MSEYTKVVTHTFYAAGEQWAIASFSKDYIYIEETRKNGQEDSHICFHLHLEDGKWSSEKSFSGYDDDGWARGPVEDFINEHGLPQD